MGALGGENEGADTAPERDETKSRSAMALGVLAVIMLMYFTLAVGAKLPADGSMVMSVLAACLPLRWNGAAEAYENVGERASAIVSHAGPTLNRHAGGVVVLILTLWFTRRTMGHTANISEQALPPPDSADRDPVLRGRRTANGPVITQRG